MYKYTLGSDQELNLRRIGLMLFPIFLFVIFTTMYTDAAAQDQENDHPYQSYAGIYGSSDGICLFEDQTFMLYGYATAVFGRYVVEDEIFLFYPDQVELFQVYASKSKEAGNGTKINFVGFDGEGESYVRLNDEGFERVFNEDANCFSGPFVYEHPKRLSKLSLLAQPGEEVQLGKNFNNAFSYVNTEGYNDFIFVYTAPKREYQNFKGSLVRNAEGTAIVLSNFGGDQGYEKHDQDAGEMSEWGEILEMKQQYSDAKESSRDGLLVNKHYTVFDLALSQYLFDPEEYIYKFNQAEELGDYYDSDPYNDLRYLRKFVKLKPDDTTEEETAKVVSTKSIFFTVCGEGSENSYRFEALDQL